MMESFQISTRNITRRIWKSSRAYSFSYSTIVLLIMSILLPFAASAGRPGPLHTDGGCWECGKELSKPSGSIKPQTHAMDLSITFQASGVLNQNSEGRSLLNALGSSPPQCTSKCGSCKPCSPVHVAIHPGLVKTTEYYPEAWRCKCRENLYMP